MERLRISENNRYFVKADGTPFVWLADTDWTMPQRIKWDDVEYFMKKRKNQGFSVLQIVALDPEMDVEMHNPAGEKALLNDNLLTPNENYFTYLDWILDKAEEFGFYVLLLPVWGQLVVGHNWMGQTFEKTVTVENAFQYGEWIGSRYKDRKNIIWCLGGDRQPIHLGVDYKDVWRRMAEGLAKGVTGKLLTYDQKDPAWKEMMITYHACHEMETGECSTMSYWTDEEAWISFIMLQSGHGLIPKNYELVAKAYNREKVMPVWDGEPAYEMMPTSWPVITGFHGSWMVRKRAYWSLFAGAFGYTYGHCSVWCSVSEKELNEMNKYTWYQALDSEGSAQMKYLRDFMESMQIMTYIPCQEILPEANDGVEMDYHQQACISPEKDTICVYLPSGGDAELNLSCFETENAEEICLWWYNTRDGKCCSDTKSMIGNAECRGMKNGMLSVSAPTEGEEQDWVLIVTKNETEVPVREQVYYELESEGEMKKVFEW